MFHYEPLLQEQSLSVIAKVDSRQTLYELVRTKVLFGRTVTIQHGLIANTLLHTGCQEVEHACISTAFIPGGGISELGCQPLIVRSDSTILRLLPPLPLPLSLQKPSRYSFLFILTRIYSSLKESLFLYFHIHHIHPLPAPSSNRYFLGRETLDFGGRNIS
jgi:hypothetical protein